VVNNRRVFRGSNETEEKTKITCPNKACNKVFDKPLRTINLQYDPKVLHDACPYCLEAIPAAKAKSKKQTDNIATPETETETEKEKPVQNQEKTSDCKYHFGFLSEKEPKQQIPDECILCPEIIDCMIKK
jgi:hypothetical protein